MPRVQLQSARTRALNAAISRQQNVQNPSFNAVVRKFEKRMKEIEFANCVSCSRRLWSDSINGQGQCRSCSGNGRNPFTADNGMDLGEIPPQLSGLTLIEQLLIARVHPVVSVFKIRGNQIGYTGHTMNFAQHITTIATTLPCNLAQLDSVILMNRDTPNGIVHFRVRSGKVRRALEWLKANNQYYRDIIIDHNRLNELPIDDDVSQRLMRMEVEEPEWGLCPQQNNPAEQANPEGELDDLLRSSGFPNVPGTDSVAAIDRNLQPLANFSQGVPWPAIDNQALNEFTTEGIIVQAFPCLFPYGRGDLHAPRFIKLTTHAYFSYLMDYRDGRFSKDLRFPYYAYNTMARWDAINAGNTYIKDHLPNQISPEALLEIARNPDSDIATQIMYYGSKLRGTRAYWKQRSAELLQMVSQLGSPSIFFTLSAADYHWPDLFRLLAPGVDAKTLSEKDRAKLMHENPMITAHFFNKRVLIFMKEVVDKLFKVTDFWYRFECQHRGSPHIHGLLWLEDSPDCSDIGSLDDEGKAAIVDYYDKLIFATIEERIQLITRENPCRQRYTDLTDNQKRTDLSKLLSNVQTHSQCGRHCLRCKRGSRRQVCRYNFPEELREESCLLRDFESGFWRFHPKRNDDRLQRYNPLITQIWRGNTDFSAITSKEAVLRYISKYASKAEVESESYSEIFRRSVTANENNTDNPRLPATLIRQLIVGSVAERNYSAQEIMHLIQGWPLYHASRTFVVLNISGRWRPLQGESNTAFVTQYSTRNGLDDISLYDFVKSWRKNGQQYIPRTKDVIVRVIPYLKPCPEDPEANENYFTFQCMLHIPWRGDHRAQLPRESTWEDYFESFDMNPGANIPDEFPQPDEIEFDDVPLDRAQMIRDASMVAARMHPGLNPHEPLGTRAIDEIQVWPTESEEFNERHIREFFQLYRNAQVQQRQQQALVPLFSLSPKQREVLEICSKQIRDPNHRIKRVLVQGKAGTGKSAVIKHMCSMLDDAFPVLDPQQPDKGKSYVVLAPTGAAALNVDGATIHRFFHIPTSGSDFLPLQGESLRNFQKQCEKLKFIIIDEYSMVGMTLLTKIHKRLQETRPGSLEAFAGYNIYLFGDLRQLPPVMDTAIYGRPKNNFTAHAPWLITSIQEKIALSQCHRQSADQARFKELLDNLAKGTVTEAQYTYLMSRRSALPYDTNAFKDAVHLYPVNEAVLEHNNRRLAAMGQPVVCIEASHNNLIAARGDDQQAQGLAKELFLAIGSRIMLRKNLDVARGLVNGSLGVVTRIIYRTDEIPPSLPLVIMVEFDRYQGPFINDREYPLLPHSASWRTGQTDCTRKQFPINLAYALTIHKSQGLTLDKAIVDIGKSERTPGLSYVALSRVRRIDDLLLSASFSYDRFQKIGRDQRLKDREEFLRTLGLGF